MRCPKCGSENTHALSEVNTTTNTKGYGCCKGIIGYVILGPIGWLCGLCGMGNGTTVTTTRTYWTCNDCGNKFK